jgi:hypothetical protein
MVQYFLPLLTLLFCLLAFNCLHLCITKKMLSVELSLQLGAFDFRKSPNKTEFHNFVKYLGIEQQGKPLSHETNRGNY